MFDVSLQILEAIMTSQQILYVHHLVVNIFFYWLQTVTILREPSLEPNVEKLRLLFWACFSVLLFCSYTFSWSAGLQIRRENQMKSSTVQRQWLLHKTFLHLNVISSLLISRIVLPHSQCSTLLWAFTAAVFIISCAHFTKRSKGEPCWIKCSIIYSTTV